MKNHENLKVRFDMEVKDIYRFMLYAFYFKKSVIFMLLVTLYGMAMTVYSFSHMTRSSTYIYIFVTCFFPVFQPVFLWIRAKTQKKINQAFSEAMTYEFSDESFSLYQGENILSFPWGDIDHILITKRDIIVYGDASHAYILPRTKLEHHESEILSLIETAVPGSKVKNFNFI